MPTFTGPMPSSLSRASDERPSWRGGVGATIGAGEAIVVEAPASLVGVADNTVVTWDPYPPKAWWFLSPRWSSPSSAAKVTTPSPSGSRMVTAAGPLRATTAVYAR